MSPIPVVKKKSPPATGDFCWLLSDAGLDHLDRRSDRFRSLAGTTVSLQNLLPQA